MSNIVDNKTDLDNILTNKNNIYVLRLINDKYYVGKTSRNVTTRFEEHLNNLGSEWTKIHTPVEIVETIENADEFDEDKYVKKYMKLKGIQNVRGGSYCKVNLSQDQIRLLTQEIRGSNDSCFVCGSLEHFARDCKSKQNDSASSTSNTLNSTRTSFISLNCVRCGRNNHLVKDCFAKYSLSGQKLKYKDFKSCFRCGRNNHRVADCFAKFDIDGYLIDESQSSDDDNTDDSTNSSTNSSTNINFNTSFSSSDDNTTNITNVDSSSNKSDGHVTSYVTSSVAKTLKALFNKLWK